MINKETKEIPWQPISLVSLISKRGIKDRKVLALMGIWLGFIALGIVVAVVEGMMGGLNVTLPIGGTDFNITIYPPLVLAIMLVFWLGFEWGAVLAYVATFVSASFAGMPLGWKLLFSFADVIGLYIFVMAYRSVRISYIPNTFKRFVYFSVVAFISALVSSTASFIWSHIQNVGTIGIFKIWQGWWIGGFLHAVVVNAPIFILVGGRVEQWKDRHFSIMKSHVPSLKWISTSVITATMVLAVFVWGNSYLGAMELEKVMDGLTTQTRNEITVALDSLQYTVWTAIILILSAGLGGILLVQEWNSELKRQIINRTKELQESQQLFKSLFVQNSQPVFYMDLDGTLLDVNKESVKMAGYSREEMIGRSIYDFARGEDRDKLEKHFNRAREGDSQEFEIVAYSRDGEEMNMEVRHFPIYIDGEITGIFGIASDITEEKQAKRKLEESEQRFKSLFERNPNAVYSFDLEGNFRMANTKLEELTGYSVEEMKELNFEPMVAPEERERVWGKFEKAAQGEAQTYETTGIRKNGDRFHVNVTNLPIYINGQIEGVFGIAQDITEHKNTLQKLRESEERWQRLVENSPQCVVIHRDRTIEYINSAGTKLLGGESPEKMIGTSIIEFIHPDSLDRAEKRLRKIQDEEMMIPPSEQKIIRKNGGVRNVIVHSVPITFKGQKAAQTVLQDVTELKDRERALKESEERWHRLIEENPQPVQVVRIGDDRIMFINPKGAELYGAENPEELVGRSVFDFIDDKSREKVKGRKETLDDKKTPPPAEVKIRRLDGEERFIEVHSIPIQYEGEKAIQTVIHDVTKRKEHEQYIERSLKEKEVLLKEIHHRVKNNLAVISGLLELQSMNSEADEVTDTLRECQLRIQSMSMIHEKLYQTDTLSDIGFDEYIVELVQTIEATHNFGDHVEVRFDLDSISLNINQAIPCALILNELLVNSYKHAFDDGEKGTIQVGLEKQNGQVYLTVSDDGKGLPDDFSLEQQHSLGMTLVRTLLAQLQADLKIDPAGNEQKGAEFSIRFDTGFST